MLEWGTANIDLALVRALKVDAPRRRRCGAGLSLEPAGERLRDGRAGHAAAGRHRPPRDADARPRAALVDPLLRLAAGAAPVEASSSRLARRLPGFPSGSRADRDARDSADPFSRVELAPDLIRAGAVGGLVVAVGLGIED